MGERLGDLRRGLARLGERVGELLVHELCVLRRRQPGGELSGAVELVLQRRERVPVVPEAIGVRGEDVEASQRQTKVDPETGHRSRVRTRGAAAERLCHGRSIISLVDLLSMSVTETVRSPAEYEERLQKYLYERSEEGRAVRVGEKEVSERAAIVARYSDLFSRAQLASLHECEERASDDDERERLYRLRKTCESGLAADELAEAEDELENKILAARVTWNGEELPLRNAQAKLAVLDDYGEREELGTLQAEASAGFNPDRLELLARFEALIAELTGVPENIERNEQEKQISLRTLEGALAEANTAIDGAWERLRTRWFDRLLGPDREDVPSSFHSAYMRRLSPLESTYTKERAVEVCMDTLASSASTWRTTRTSASTSTIARRSRRAPA